MGDTSVLESQEFLLNLDSAIGNLSILDDQECPSFQILESTPIKSIRYSTYKTQLDPSNVDFFCPDIVLPSAENKIKNENSHQYEISTGNERKTTEKEEEVSSDAAEEEVPSDVSYVNISMYEVECNPRIH